MVFAIHWRESAMDLHVFSIPIPPPPSLSTQSFWVFPVHQAWALVSCTQPGLVICFTLDNIHVSTQEYFVQLKKASICNQQPLDLGLYYTVWKEQLVTVLFIHNHLILKVKMIGTS